MKSLLLAATALTVLSFSALAADLPSRTVAPSVPATAISWTGFYVGVQIGAAKSNSNLSGFGFLQPAQQSWNSYFGGLHAGYDYQVGRFVVGLEGDVNARSGKNSYNFLGGVAGFPFGWESRSPSDASIRTRLGYLLIDNALVYATGGVAFQNFKFANPVSPGAAVWGNANLYGGVRTGWTLGAGVQYAVTQNWSANVEYRYSSYGTKSTSIASLIENAKLWDSRVTVGLSYKFGG